MKLPNGMGSVYKLSGKRRHPWAARITTGWTVDKESNKAKQSRVIIGYYPTRSEALEALMSYNQNPYDIQTDSITFAEVYEKWSSEHFETIVPSARRTWVSAYNHSAFLHDMRFKDIRVSHLEKTIANEPVGQSTKQRMKSLYNLMFRYALKHEITDKDYAALCDSVKSGKPEIVRIPFSQEEIDKLWDSLDTPFVDMVLIGIYSGWRPQELAILRSEDVDMEAMTMRGGLKTDAGKNRVVPIHPRIAPLIKDRLSGNKSTLFDDDGPMTYDRYRNRWNKVMKLLGMDHRPHDTRHTFITLSKDADMNEYILKLIVGHAITDITEKTYTHRTIEQLHHEINKIK